YYHCPNPKYPHMRFVVNAHPQGACIPCCGLKAQADSDSKLKNEIYEVCTKTHFYTKSKKNVVESTRYIMNYGKYIAPGRICGLPELTVEPLFYESFSTTYHGIESICETENRFFLVGMEQKWGNVDVGMLYI